MISAPSFLSKSKVDLLTVSTSKILSSRSFLPPNFEPSNYDVICGRGKMCDNHIGNRRFRVTIEINLAQYKNAISKVDRALVINGIIDQIRAASSNGGFVKKDLETGQWFVLEDEAVREKVGRATRDFIASLQGASKVKSPPSIDCAINESRRNSCVEDKEIFDSFIHTLFDDEGISAVSPTTSVLPSNFLPIEFEPSNYDVICGRGKMCDNHIGNRRFEVTICMNLDKYMKAVSKFEKSLVITSIIDQQRATFPNGWFVKKDLQSGMWLSLGDEPAREKVGHAIRDALAANHPMVTFTRRLSTANCVTSCKKAQTTPRALVAGLVRRSTSSRQKRRTLGARCA